MGDDFNENQIEEATGAVDTPDVEPEHLPVPDNAGEIVDVASRDIVSEVLDIPEWGFAVELKSFTAAQQATIRQIGFQQGGGEGIIINWALMEITQLQMGIVRPSFSEKTAKQLHMKSGAGIQRIIKWLDEKSGLDKKAMEAVKDEFPGSDKPAEV